MDTNLPGVGETILIALSSLKFYHELLFHK